MFDVKSRRLPHAGVIPGARGHKKIVIPKGTTVWCVEYGGMFFWAAYLDEQSAITVAESLQATIQPSARRHIPLGTLLAWNFKLTIPVRISRPKT